MVDVEHGTWRNISSILVRPEDRLKGTSNFNTLKAMILNILKENDLDGYILNGVEEPTTNDGLTTFKKNEAKAKRIIYDSVKVNVMPVITPLNIAKEWFNTLTNIYEKKDLSQKRELKKNICNVMMETVEIVTSFFTNISQVRDQLLSIGVMVDDDDIIQTIVNGLPYSLETFLATINCPIVQPKL